MGKRKNWNYMQVYNGAVAVLNKHNHTVPYSTRWLYVHLCHLEHRFYDKKIDGFFRSIKDLSHETRMGTNQVVNGIKILNKQRLIESWQMHWVDKKTGKKSEKHITAFRILEV